MNALEFTRATRTYGHESAWVLNEIGKDLPITIGVAVQQGTIEMVRILWFRESRGWEVRYPFFTDQFHDASLDADGQLRSLVP